jgi:hypothetical protein
LGFLKVSQGFSAVLLPRCHLLAKALSSTVFVRLVFTL